jgi:hypothetical protein
MHDLNIRKVGEGPRCYAVWLDHWPVFLDGLDGLPHIGDRFEIEGELWGEFPRFSDGSRADTSHSLWYEEGEQVRKCQ